MLREEITCDPDEFDLNYYTYGLHIYKNMPLIEPLESREVKKIQEFAVVLDTSYSTSGELIRNFLKETFAVLSEQDSFFTQCRMHIIQCDEKVRSDVEIKSREELKQLLTDFTVVGGGGTDFRPAFSYINELVEQGVFKNLKGLLYFTDGKGTYPKRSRPIRRRSCFWTIMTGARFRHGQCGFGWSRRNLAGKKKERDQENRYEYQTGKRRDQTYGTGVFEER
ncbi:MAG: VWA-like domain-containing protein [Lachnospiraceae bacterium]